MLAALLAIMLAALAQAQTTADPAAGKFWYEQSCARCHGSPPQERQAGTPNITGASAAGIRQALATVSAMSRVFVSETQIAEIEGYLREPLTFAASPGIDFSDAWYDLAQSGWGISVHQRPNSRMFVTLYIYTDSGEPMWLVSSEMRWSDPLTVSGDLLNARAAGFPVSGFDSRSVSLRPVGKLSFRFSDRRSGVVEFTIDGRSYLRNITRLAF